MCVCVCVCVHGCVLYRYIVYLVPEEMGEKRKEGREKKGGERQQGGGKEKEEEEEEIKVMVMSCVVAVEG